MGKIAREIVERAGIDVDVLLDMLVAAARGELAACYRYTILRVPAACVMDEGLREVLTDIRAEDRNHFDALAARIYELDGRLPHDIRPFAADVSGEDLPSGFDRSNHALVTAFIESERRAVLTYTHLCDFTRGKDHRTYELADAILDEELEHEAWLREFLGTGPPARFHRGFRGRSPFLARLPHDDRGPG